jgi:6,7-dimethyl-8-ribityllumazine synthase
MAQNEDRTGTSPFEDTGDWPFRESELPRAEAEEDSSAGDLGSTRPFDLDDLAAAQGDVPTTAPPEGAAEPLEPSVEVDAVPAPVEVEPESGPELEAEAEPAEHLEPDLEPALGPALEPDLEPAPALAAAAAEVAVEHAPGELRTPDGIDVMEGAPNGFRRTVAIVVSRFNAEITNRLLEQALQTLTDAHVARESITIVPVPGAFELPLAAMALAKTRRFSCVVALGCVIRGETSHFDFVASEAASGLQLAGIETGVPVSFGLLTCNTRAQAEARIDRAADAARAALEMADLFTQVRTRAARSG